MSSKTAVLIKMNGLGGCHGGRFGVHLEVVLVGFCSHPVWPALDDLATATCSRRREMGNVAGQQTWEEEGKQVW